MMVLQPIHVLHPQPPDIAIEPQLQLELDQPVVAPATPLRVVIFLIDWHVKRFMCRNSLFNTKILVLELQAYDITYMDYIGDMSFLDMELIQPNGMSLLAIN
jgi:hypothetical protein